jgi:hypothetical protein
MSVDDVGRDVRHDQKGDQPLRAVSRRTLVTVGGGALVSALATAGAAGQTVPDRVGAGARSVADRLADTISVKDFGATGSGVRTASEHTGFEAALAAVQNPNDPFFTGQVDTPNGIYPVTASIDLPRSSGFLSGSGGAILWGTAGEHVFRANGASFALSSLSNLKTYGGLDALHAGTAGEIASIKLTDFTAVRFAGTGLYFSAGLTSSKIIGAFVDGNGTAKGHALHCAGGINNNNVVADSDFVNMAGDVVRIEGLTQGWQFRNLRIEAAGQMGAAQFDLAAPSAVAIHGGWSENSHEYLLRATGGDDKVFGVSIDGLVSIGSANGRGGFTGSKFDVGAKRIIFGNNIWREPTTAPANAFVTGVNENLRTFDSVVWTRDCGGSFHVIARRLRVASATTFTLNFSRPSGASVSSNQQTVTVDVRLVFSGYNVAGTSASWGALRYRISFNAVGNIIHPPMITNVGDDDGYSASSVAIAVTGGVRTATITPVTFSIVGLNPEREGLIHAEIEGLSSSFNEAERFVLGLA